MKTRQTEALGTQRMNNEPSHEAEQKRDPVISAAIDWFVRLRAGEGDPRVAAAFREWAVADQKHAEAFAQVAEMWGAPELALAAGSADTRRRRRRAMASGGAALAIMITAGAVFGPGMWLRLNADYITATGDMETVRLPDGSMMMLNTASAVALDFEEGRRTVRLLAGEAYFDVVSDHNRPFRVASPEGVVMVTGTAFAVRTGEEADLVVLQRGSVTVAPRNGGSEARLAPGEGVSVRATDLAEPEPQDIGTALAWLEGRLRFEAQPLEVVLAEVGRYRSGPVVMLSSSLGQTPVSGDYRLEDPDLIVRSLAAAVGASATFLPGGIVILR